jgi:NADPH:quinone reductase-like Zn-dependent oxidoreductase
LHLSFASLAYLIPTLSFLSPLARNFSTTDPFSTMSVAETEIPTPASGQILVRMTAMAVNPADFFSILGIYPGFQPNSLPASPGLEGCGVVAGVGPTTKIPRDLKGLKTGSRVVPYFGIGINELGGSWTEYVLVSVDDVILIPDTVSDESAAQLVVNPMTVIGMLDKLDPPKGAYILQSAGGSTLGKQLVQVANKRGLHVISTVRRCEQVQELKAYRSKDDHVLCTETDNLTEKVMEITNGAGAYGAVDAVAGELTAQLLDATRDGGNVLVYGALAGLQFTGSVVASLFRDVTVSGYWVTADVSQRDPAARRKLMRQAMDYMEEGVVVPHTGKKFPLEQAVDAVKESNTPGRSSEGKVLLVTDPECFNEMKAEL